MRGFLAGVIGLIALQTLVGTDQGAKNAGGVIDVVTKGIAGFVDPTKPAIADHSKPSDNQPFAPSDPKAAGPGSGGNGGLGHLPGAGPVDPTPFNGAYPTPTTPPVSGLFGGQVTTS